MTVRSEIRRLGGAARAGELAERGFGAGVLRIACESGEVQRPRKGWYVDGAEDARVVEAVRVGGAVTCLTGASVAGLRVPEHEARTLHVAVPSTSSRLRDPRDRHRPLDGGARVHWTDTPRRRIVPLDVLVDHVGGCSGPEDAFAVLESAVHRRRVELLAAERIARRAPALRRFASLVGDLSESGTESRMKLLLAELGLPFRQQVAFPGVGRVDFLVGRDLVVEVDSRAHHIDPIVDRRRDALLSASGRRSLRFVYSQVLHAPDEVRSALVGAVIRGDVRPVLQDFRR